MDHCSLIPVLTNPRQYLHAPQPLSYLFLCFFAPSPSRLAVSELYLQHNIDKRCFLKDPIVSFLSDIAHSFINVNIDININVIVSMSAFVPSTSFTGISVRPAVTNAVNARRPVVPSTPLTPRRAMPSTSRVTPTCRVATDRLTNRSFQLEEDEDSLSCTSAVFLQADGTMTIGRTDGPSPDKVNASWTYNASDGELVLDIERYFSTDGNVPFCVKRVLRGHLDDSRKNLEELPCFTGAMYQAPADYSKHSEIGWWAMILAVDDLPSDDFDISSSP